MSVKFKIWDEGSNGFICPADYGSFEILENGGIYIPPVSIPENFKWGHDQGYAVCEFTGIRDKNGKDVYEGDIIRYNRRGGIVADGKTYTGIICFRSGKMKYLAFRDTLDEPINEWSFLLDTFEIIGNSFENKELLNSETFKAQYG